MQKLKDATPAGVLHRLLIHPRIAGHRPTLYQGGLPSTRQLELLSAKPLRNGGVATHYRLRCGGIRRARGA